MVPETSMMLINAADDEGKLSVTNTDDHAVLLYTAIENTPEDPGKLLLVTSPITRVEAGEKQLVRFVFLFDTPLATQRLKYLTFEGVPQMGRSGRVRTARVTKQSLPIIISPADLPSKSDPWTLLKWEARGRTLTVHNDSRYVVMLNQQIDLVPSGRKLKLPRNYILPGQSDSLKLPTGTTLDSEGKVRLYLDKIYGSQGVPYEAPLALK